jgi:dimethylargininase
VPVVALTRAVSDSIRRCELTHLERTAIDVDVARRQHEAYEQALVRLGCEVHRLPAAADLPDSVFIEDAAVVLDEVAIVTRPGAPSRRPEVTEVERALLPYRRVAVIDDPGTMDGGDVLVVDRTIYVGASGRTNAAGVEQLIAVVTRLGYRVQPVPLRGCLHLKSAVTAISTTRLLLNRQWVDPDPFRDFDLLDVDASEPSAANAVRIGNTVLYPTAFPRTKARLEQCGIDVVTVDVSELAKAEGAVTCCSLIFRK